MGSAQLKNSSVPVSLQASLQALLIRKLAAFFGA
jgi:hypothetical protein